MKQIKIRTLVLAFFVGGLLLTSCKDEVASNNQTTLPTQENKETTSSTTQGVNVDVSPINKTELDSMKNIIENINKQVGECSNRTDKYDTEIKNLKKQASNNKLYLLISIGLGLISLLIAIIALIQASF